MEELKPDSLNSTTKKRSVFLTFLCILSFAGILFMIYSSVVKLYSLSDTESFFRKISLLGIPSQGFMDYDNFVHFTRIYHIINLSASFICLVGVIAMWKLRKAGFYIYAAGELAPVIAFFILFRNFFHNPLMSFTFLITAILMFIVAVAFLIMYAINLKRMY